MSEEEIDKLIKSLEQISSFIGFSGINPEEMVMIHENMLLTSKEMMDLIQKQNGRWVDIYEKTQNSFCKVLIKGLIDKNFISLKEIEENGYDIKKELEKYKKMI